MQWLAALFVLSLGIGLRRRAERGAYAVLVLGVAVIVVLWYVQLTPYR